MTRREFIYLTGSAAALPLLRVPVARAQEPERIYKLGMVTGAGRQASRIVAFFDELKGFDFVEGQNLKIIAGGFDVRDDQSSELAATLAKCDLYEQPALDPGQRLTMPSVRPPPHAARFWRDLYCPEMTAVAKLAANVFHRLKLPTFGAGALRPYQRPLQCRHAILPSRK